MMSISCAMMISSEISYGQSEEETDSSNFLAAQRNQPHKLNVKGEVETLGTLVQVPYYRVCSKLPYRF